MQTHRCDRCGKETKEVIDLRLVNQNDATLTGDENSIWGQTKEYKHRDSELCFDCTGLLLHWMGHQENEFTLMETENENRRKGRKDEK